MIAIPVDTASTDAKSSKLFGNVEMFAIYEPKDKRFFFIKNQEAGNGIKTAKLLKEYEVNSVVYSYMGNGPFKELNKDNVTIFYIGKEPIGLSDIVSKIEANTFIKVDANNASTYLDPGTSTQNCECTCS